MVSGDPLVYCTCWTPTASEASLVVCILLLQASARRVDGGAGYTFRAFAILVVLSPRKKPTRAQLCARSVPAPPCVSPPGARFQRKGVLPGQAHVSPLVSIPRHAHNDCSQGTAGSPALLYRTTTGHAA